MSSVCVCVELLKRSKTCTNVISAAFMYLFIYFLFIYLVMHLWNWILFACAFVFVAEFGILH